ncbi:hypothetical protein EV586_1025 [Tumebacillus sp. BK434]|nr:hypothetical protein [Tumebacillus sp. BK434]TCP57564.1 hypothetical protein EV586_1025 [Tumebacillus sp. BK434]
MDFEKLIQNFEETKEDFFQKLIADNKRKLAIAEFYESQRQLAATNSK